MKKVAILIGNKDYECFTSLDTPINDITALEHTFKKYGFNTETYMNVNFHQMEDIISKFKNLYNIPGIYILYFAGHGFSADGVNYLAAIDATLPSLQYTSVAINDFLVNSRDSYSLIFIDACRTNAYELLSNPAARSLTGNPIVPTMVEQEIYENTIISFSTSFGHTAVDKLSGTAMSPYAYYLNQNLKHYCRDIYTLFNKTRIDVSTYNSKQIPIELVSLKNDFFLYDKTKLPINVYFLYQLIKNGMSCAACKNFSVYLWSSEDRLIGLLPGMKNISISLRRMELIPEKDEIECICVDDNNFFITSNQGYIIYTQNTQWISKYVINHAIFDIRIIPHRRMIALVSNLGLHIYHMDDECVTKICEGYIYALELSNDRNNIYFFLDNCLFYYNIDLSTIHKLIDLNNIIHHQVFVYSIKLSIHLLICATSVGLLIYDTITHDVNFFTIQIDKFPGIININDLMITSIPKNATNYFHCMDISPDFRFVACGTQDGKVIIWDLIHKFALEPIIVSAVHKPITSIAWGYQYSIIAIVEYKTVVAISPESKSHIMDLSLEFGTEITGFDSFSLLCNGAIELPSGEDEFDN